MMELNKWSELKQQKFLPNVFTKAQVRQVNGQQSVFCQQQQQQALFAWLHRNLVVLQKLLKFNYILFH